MKKITYFCIILCFSSIMIFLWNCTDPELVKYSSQVLHENFSIEEAKEFFEKQTINYVSNTRAKTEKKKKKLSTGDITPIWDDAVASSNKNIACYDIPIESEYKYKAVYSDYYNGKASAKKVDVYQKLIVVKDMQTQQLGQYILTLIPDKEYEDKYRKKVGERFINCKKKLDFTGVAIYTIPNMDLIIRVNHYTNGVKDQGVYLPGKPELLKKKLVVVRSMLKNILIKHKRTVSTRSWGEDDWDDWDDWDDDDWLWDDNDDENDYDIEYEWDKDIITEWENSGGTVVEIGDSWLFIDEDGNWFAMEDSDGNGNPDCVIITPDPDPEDDPEPQFPGSEGGNPEEGGNGGGDDGDDDDGGSGGTGDNGDDSGDTSKQVTPSQLQQGAKDAVSHVSATYGTQKAYCNVGVATAFQSLFGGNGDSLKGMNANSMVQHWRDNPGKWEKIPMSQAQSLANKGHFVVAGWINPNGGSGHVVVVVPGESVYSRSWGGYIPNVMDTGSGMRSEKQTINYSFGKDKISRVEFYKYK
jgi:hypothetical protein